jgi:hypothetical protein
MKLYNKLQNYNIPLYFSSRFYKNNKDIKLMIEFKKNNKIHIKYVNYYLDSIKIKPKKLSNNSGFSKKIIKEFGYEFMINGNINNLIIIKCKIIEKNNNWLLCNNTYDELFVILPDFLDNNSYLLHKYSIYRTGIFTNNYSQPHIFRMENT